MKIAVLADEETVWGFRLAGVREASTSPDGFREFLNRQDILVVFYQNRFLDGLPPRERKAIQESTQPLFVPLEGEEDIGELMKRALGVEVM